MYIEVLLGTLGSEVNISPKNNYFFTYPKNGPARDSSTPWFLVSNISARAPKKTHSSNISARAQWKAFFYAQLNKKLAKSALYHIMHCLAFFPWFKGPFELPFSIKYTVGPLRSGIPNLVRIRTKVTKMVRNRSGIGHLTWLGPDFFGMPLVWQVPMW